MSATEQAPLDIAVGILVDNTGRLLIARRRAGTPGEGLWEFPGGKREGDEPMADCLARELAEEIGVHDCRLDAPLIRFTHHKGERPVRLHVWRIDQWQGEPSGLEGQELAWAERGALADYRLLPATDVILCALDLPARYAITPALSAADSQQWWARFEALIARPDMPLLRLRDQGLDDAAYQALAAKVIEAAHAQGVAVLVDRSLSLCRAVGADGLHWPLARLIEAGRPALASGQRLAVSAHTGKDLAMAVERGADFAVLSPVAATPTHPGAKALGWDGWHAARADYGLPVYALGGLGEADLQNARQHNAQGVAAIRAFWPDVG
ncbi:Nudix family hydrolase [Salinisphaera sp. T5B8]|uniref:Nudix family hydrolase n=1 Tax=Salinisphaera sp. T5B8 TaxID=1304154 RepID=UPI00333FDB26